jgi:signal transduction histidine kinase
MIAHLRRTLKDLSERQAVAAVGEFASALAHEVRNPLSAMRLNLQHLDEQLTNQPELRPGVSQALRDIDRLEKTVAGALRVARTGNMAMSAIELRPVMEAALSSAAPEFALRRAVLERNWPVADNVIVRGNAAALEQVFLNLLLNAAQAMEPGGRAGVDVKRVDARVVVTVWDTGSGMNDDERARVFEPFYSTKQEGSGLGLTVAKRIVTAHRGAIDVESAPGAGARVRIALPAG